MHDFFSSWVSWKQLTPYHVVIDLHMVIQSLFITIPKPKHISAPIHWLLSKTNSAEKLCRACYQQQHRPNLFVDGLWSSDVQYVMLDKLSLQVQLTISSSATKISPNNGSTFFRMVVMVFMHIQSLDTILYLICLASNNLGSVYSNVFLFLGSWSQHEVGYMKLDVFNVDLYHIFYLHWSFECGRVPCSSAY